MGYYVSLTSANAVLPKEHLDEAMSRLLELNTHDEWKRGFSSGPDGTSRHFSWMSENYDQELTTVKEIFEALGYEVDETEEGLDLVEYGSKTGCEDVFVWYIADLFREDSYMFWQGEDGAQEEWRFGGEPGMTVTTSRIIWSEPAPFEPTNYAALDKAIDAFLDK